MPKITSALAVAIAVLLALIVLELHQINRSLAWISAPVRGVAAEVADEATRSATETREERIERKVRENRELAAEQAEIWKRTLTDAPPSKAANSRPSR